MLPFRNYPIAGHPVIKDIIEEQAGPVFLFDTRLIQSNIGDLPYTDCLKRFAFRQWQVLLRGPREDQSHISPDDLYHHLLLILIRKVKRLGVWVILN